MDIAVETGMIADCIFNLHPSWNDRIVDAKGMMFLPDLLSSNHYDKDVVLRHGMQGCSKGRHSLTPASALGREKVLGPFKSEFLQALYRLGMRYQRGSWLIRKASCTQLIPIFLQFWFIGKDALLNKRKHGCNKDL